MRDNPIPPGTDLEAQHTENVSYPSGVSLLLPVPPVPYWQTLVFHFTQSDRKSLIIQSVWWNMVLTKKVNNN